MVILILIDVQYSQRAVFSLKKIRIVKITLPQILVTRYKFPIPPPPTPLGDAQLQVCSSIYNLLVEARR